MKRRAFAIWLSAIVIVVTSGPSIRAALTLLEPEEIAYMGVTYNGADTVSYEGKLCVDGIY
jgi:hypothetical protein